MGKFTNLKDAEESYQLALDKALELDKQNAELMDIAINTRLILTSNSRKPGRKLLIDDLVSRIDAQIALRR